MDDLISRQKTLDHLRKRLIQTANNNVGFVCDAGSTFQDASERVKTWLDEVPSIDAVPVIRCKDCIHSTSQVSDDEDNYYCNVMMRCMHSLEYCSHGERKESCTQEQ